MTARHAGIPGELFGLCTSGWIVSLCLHGSIIFLTGVLVAKIGLAPPSSLFHWDVTVISHHPPTPTVPASPEVPIASSKVTKPIPRNTPSSAAANTRSLAPLRTPPTSTSTAVATDYQTVDSVLTPHHEEPQRALEHIPAVPLHEQQESESEQSVQHHATLLPAEAPIESHLPQLTPVPPEAEAPPASEPLPHSSDPQVAPHTATTPSQVASLTSSTATTPVARKPDYGWLADSLLHRIETLKQYPASARLNHLEGRVIVRIVIEEDGRIASVAIAKSSGHDLLDQAALETLRQASPIALSRPLEKSPVTIQIPLSYSLGR